MVTKHFRMPKQTLQTVLTEGELSPILDFISLSDQKEGVTQKNQGTLTIPNNTEKNTQITLRISKALLAQVDERAKELNMSRASFIKAVLSIALKDGLKI